MANYLQNLLHLSLEAAPWLLFGLIIAGLLKAFIPQTWLEKHLGGDGFKPMLKAAFFGAPLPLCSCGVIPAALAIRRAGASRQSTISFLVSTPETGVDSVSVTYALLGPVMAITRPITAIVSALLSGFLVMREPHNKVVDSAAPSPETADDCCTETKSCCSSTIEETSSCCSTKEMKTESNSIEKTIEGIRYTFRQLFKDIVWWLLAGLMFAAAVQTFVPTTFLTQWGSGLLAMIVMILVGIPMYVCATASTPIAAGLMLAGISPGTALVFLMAGPATNIASLGIISKELGKQAVTAYLAGVSITAIVAGLTLDAIVEKFDIDVTAQLTNAHHWMPAGIAWASLIILVVIAFSPLVTNRKVST